MVGLPAAALALGAAYFHFHSLSSESPPRYPELQAVSRTDFERARRALSRQERGFSRRTGQADRDVGTALRGCSPLAVVAVLCDRAGPHTGCASYGPSFDDEARRPVGSWLAEQRDASLNAVLSRIAADEKIEFAVRDTAVTALCWEGNEEALPALVLLAMDMNANELLRTRVLTRLARIGAQPGEEFEVLLYLPFRDHDEYAAAILALTGKPVAPRLILDALKRELWSAGDREHLLVRAAAAVAAKNLEIQALARIAQEAIEGEWEGERGSDVPVKRAIAQLAEALDHWLAQQPAAGESRFERERRAYRESAGYRRERHVLESSAPASLPEEEIDFAAAALCITDEEGKRSDRCLDALHRMSILFGRELEGVTDPAETMQVLHRRLLPRWEQISMSPERGASSFLEIVLRERAGNCVGLTSLYVALGERLGLPLVAVGQPGHVFLRWDGKDVVLDIELTDRGRIRTEEDLKGATPCRLTSKGLLSVVLSNRSSAWLDSPMIKDEGREESALGFADDAIAYDPENQAAHQSRALCLARLGNPDEALASAERAVAIDPLNPSSLAVAGECLLISGRPGDALLWFDRALGIDPESGPVLRGRLICLEKLGREEEAAEIRKRLAD